MADKIISTVTVAVELEEYYPVIELEQVERVDSSKHDAFMTVEQDFYDRYVKVMTEFEELQYELNRMIDT